MSADADGMAMAGVTGPGLAVETFRRRLVPLGGPEGFPPVELSIVWPGSLGSEATVQARSGLMEVHGWDVGRPRRIGLEVASVAAGILAGQGALAAAIAARRGRPVVRVETSVLAAALLLNSHHVAAASSGGELIPSPSGPAPGPPFRTADGRRFEIEVFDAEAWKAFWSKLGAGDADLGRGWTAFRSRYYRGRCSLPPGFHEATARHTLSEAVDAAAVCGVSLCAVRSYPEVLADLGPWPGHPTVAVTRGAPGGARSVTRTGETGGLPLDGLRVVEATNRMQGPLAGLLLQMLGAEVVKVEPPGGDVGRMVPPIAGGVGTFFACFNRGKRSVELDLTRPSGRADLLDLAAGADAFLHNWRPGKAAQWGLEWDDLRRHNPGLVYVEASGWGERSGHNARVIGTDFLVQAHAGFGDGLSPEGDPPLTSRVLLTDFTGALITCEGVLDGLYRRQEDGGGGRVVTSLLHGAMALQAHVLADLAAGRERGRRGGRPVWGPLDRPVPAGEGFLVVAADDADAFARLCEECGVADLWRPRPVLEQEVVGRLSAEPAERWEAGLVEAGVAAAAVRRDLAALAADPSLDGLFEPLAGSACAPRSPWTISS